MLQGDDLGAESEVFGEETGGFEFEGADAEGLRGVGSVSVAFSLVAARGGVSWEERGWEGRRGEDRLCQFAVLAHEAAFYCSLSVVSLWQSD